MRVGMVVSYLQEEFGGHEFYLCRELSRIGHEVTLYTSNRTRPGYGDKKFITKDMDVGFEIKRFHAPFEISEIPVMQGLGKTLMSDKLDLIHAHEFFQFCSLTACRVAQKRRIPFILTQHGYGGLPLKKSIWLPFVLYKKTFGGYVLQKADMIITLTQAAKRALVSDGISEKKIVVIPTGVQTDLYKPSNPSLFPDYGISDEEKVILFVGRLVENKGVHILLRAFYAVQKKVIDVRLVIVGGGNLEGYLHSLAQRLGIEKKVLFLGKIPQEKMPYIYSGADVFVLPTLYSEPFGIAAIEALSSGIPVIASNIGGLKEIVCNNEVGYLVNPGDSIMLEKFLIRLLLNDNERNRLARNARQKALEKFCWEKIGRKVSELYQRTAETK
jgi:glycosyltransferase involved in cell wall biosynthesis